MIELTLNGTLDISQFWPNGQSDADTAKVVLSTNKNCFSYRELPAGTSKITKIFESAIIKSPTGNHSAINVAAKTGERSVKIRFQGIDAPELHYMPSLTAKKLSKNDPKRKKFKSVNGDFRQFWGETSTVRLGKFLVQGTKSKIMDVSVVTLVKNPNDVYDTYGRMIGDIIVKIGNKKVNVNHWLCENGLAFPTFYYSMNNDEINAYLGLTKKGKAKAKSIFKAFSSDLKKFDNKMVFDRPAKSHTPVYNETKDSGAASYAMMPKLFRRISTYNSLKASGIFTKSIKEYFITLHANDIFFKTSEFLKLGKDAEKNFFDGHLDNKNTYQLEPHEMVFMEKPSTLYDKNGKKIDKW